MPRAKRMSLLQLQKGEKKSSAGIACSINAGGRDSVALAAAKRRHLSTLKRCHPMCHLPSPDNSDRRHHHAPQPRCADQVVLSPTSYLRTSGGFRHCSCAQSLVSPTKPLGTCLHAFEKRWVKGMRNIFHRLLSLWLTQGDNYIFQL